MPHSAADLGFFDPRESEQPDTLSRFEHWWGTPVQFALLLFGLSNAGVPFEQVGAGTIGILIFSMAARSVGGRLPPGLQVGDLIVVGVTASIGFTVSLFFATAAFPGGAALAETKMGALLSFVAAPLALAVSRSLRVRSESNETPMERQPDESTTRHNGPSQRAIGDDH